MVCLRKFVLKISIKFNSFRALNSYEFHRMSKVLIIKHLPTSLSFQDKEHLLKHFGADRIWEPSSKRNYVFASFSTIEKAKASLNRLHQLEIAKRRLVVEYSFDKEPATSDKPIQETSSATTKQVKDFLRILNAWNPSIDFYQPPPVHLKYKYPEITTKIVINIIHSLFSHQPLYIQLLHLMNKMSLSTPFEENEKAFQFFKDQFRDYFLDEITIMPPESEVESEISSEENESLSAIVKPVPKLVKRKHTLPVTRKRPGAILSTPTLPKLKKPPVNQEEVFETVPTIESKKISVVVHQDALQKPSEEPEVIGELGKFEREAKPEQEEETPVEIEQPAISRKELLKNRLSYSDMKILPVFKNYQPGEPSMRLYIKNLARTVAEQDVKRIYKSYMKHLSEEDQLGFDVRVMQEGRMKGQAFVTFPSVALAETALRETNGFMLKEKPMVVQFARAAIKKTID